MTFLVPMIGLSRVERVYLASGADNSSPIFASVPFGDEAPSRRIVVFFAYQGPGSATGLLVDGEAATRIDVIANGNKRNDAYVVDLPTGTSGEIELTVSGSLAFYQFIAYAIYGASSLLPSDYDTAVGGAGMSLDVPQGGVAIATVFNNNVSTYTWSGVTEDIDDDPVFGSLSGASEQYDEAQTGLSVTYTTTSASALVSFVASWGP